MARIKPKDANCTCIVGYIDLPLMTGVLLVEQIPDSIPANAVFVAFNNCPFCGIKLEKENENEPTNNHSQPRNL